MLAVAAFVAGELAPTMMAPLHRLPPQARGSIERVLVATNLQVVRNQPTVGDLPYPPNLPCGSPDKY